MNQIMSSNIGFWANHVKHKIEILGFGYLLGYMDVNVDLLPILKQRCRDQFLQEWSMSVSNMSKLRYYKRFKKEFGFEKYLDIIKNDQLRILLSRPRFRLSSHNLEIEIGRYNNISRDSRYCKMCTLNVTESEFHFCYVVQNIEILERSTLKIYRGRL